ncbi:uncharacterized protein NESG_01205 [Nematocida ausubeli]|uniref:Sm domain-containing protein n=1 Tax=Nematocida ausubeli (strain ATCC PRA-371 / ERTm2) TaxID=1913371 RepID=A0A086J1S2_NEMA1|nr:uncharacterized protein NESG_01205 [Nematocida ausubeli]KAI5135373.1 small nuclear ribonucleoprotein F [Nematocida ausubeli]KAI5136105.1 small nuclear ribonucleoprotein F [Nematocida ausubeli]KFG26090.1 hypothetical protein NESG_01205 [Nematocida ausubeli]
MNISILGSFLPSLAGKRVAVRISTGYVYKGILAGYDDRMNVLLKKCILDAVCNKVLIRCSNIVSICRDD